MRGVPRERRESSFAASVLISTPSRHGAALEDPGELLGL
jgi:hypothetical protein